MAEKDVVFWLESSVRALRRELNQASHALQRLQADNSNARLQPQRNMVFVAKTTSSITALSGSTAGTGTVDIYKRIPSDDSLEKIGPQQTVYSCVSTSIDTDKWVMVQQDAVGDWWVTVEDC